MPETVVKCSLPGCEQVAATKIAAPWKDSRFAELKTYGFACSTHASAVADRASKRTRPSHFDPGETIGQIGSYSLGQVKD